jgi:hypothetical protein
VIVASQVLFLDYDRAHMGLPEEPMTEAPAIAESEVVPASEARPKRSRHTQAA